MIVLNFSGVEQTGSSSVFRHLPKTMRLRIPAVFSRCAQTAVPGLLMESNSLARLFVFIMRRARCSRKFMHPVLQGSLQLTLAIGVRSASHVGLTPFAPHVSVSRVIPASERL